MTHDHAVPTESLFVANARIMAAICGGQLTTDHQLGLAGFYAPQKDAPTLIQSTRICYLVDHQLAEPHDGDDTSVITERGYIEDVHAVRIRWRAADLEIEDLYFVPPDPDVVIQRVRVRNVSDRVRDVRVVAILYPQLGSPVPHRKGACREARFDAATGCLLVEDLKGNTLAFGFSASPDEHQVGEVCGHSDVYYDLEDQALSGNSRVAGVVCNGALTLLWRGMQPGEIRTVDVGLGRADSQAGAADLFRAFRQAAAGAWAACAANWHEFLRQTPPIADLPEFGPRLRALERRARQVLKAAMLPDGTPMGGITTYHNRGQVRNSCYILLALDEWGGHALTRGGYEYYVNFKLGDDRFLSADENDHLGTVLHAFRQRTLLTGDPELARRHQRGLFALADKLASLADPRCGLVYSERAIHEFVAISRGFETYVNVMAWRGLADAAALAALLDDPDKQRRFAAAADALRAAVLANLVDPQAGIFVKRLYQGRHDTLPAVSMLTPALFGLIDPRDPIVTRTLQYLREHLWDPEIGGLHRYPLRLQPWPEHPYGGPWVTYSSWLGRVHLLRGEHAEAAAIIRWVLDHTPADSNLIPEHFSVQHRGRRGFHRVYLDPCTPELWATAEFLRLLRAYTQNTGPLA